MIKKFLPLVILLLAIVAFFAFDLNSYFSLDYLREKREVLLAYIENSFVFSVLIFGLIYVICVAISAPVGLYMSLLAGFFFGPFVGTPLVVVSATIGASLLFIAARTALGDFLKKKSGAWFNKLSDGFKDNAFFYLLTLRLVPLFPFFVVNVVPAFLGVGLKTYVAATFIGIIPGSAVFVLLGQSIGSIIEEGGDLSQVVSNRPEVTIALIGLGVLSLIPPVFKYFSSKKKQTKAS